MSFTLKVDLTINGKLRTLTWPGWSDNARDEIDRTIQDFRTGQVPLEGTLTLVAGTAEQPIWSKSTRWADIKNIWIEEG